jgi:lipopolysaccharide/colanic/teichoic acid biosynthesis glycosyltransferase
MTVHYSKLLSDQFSSPTNQAKPTSALKSPYRSFFKRLLDSFVVLISAPFMLPIIGLLALLVAIEGGSPFYHQVRIGRKGRPYKMWKLRTMVIGADEKLDAYLAQNASAKLEWESTQKLKSDPRITRFGRMLRKTSLDELPQLWNVLKGDMSLVGPRPMMPFQQELYPGSAYYKLRPGITGPWQVTDRNTSTFAERARFDAGYDQNLSLKTDLRLLRATVRVVVKGTGY